MGALSFVIETWCGTSRICSRKSTVRGRSMNGHRKTRPGPFRPMTRPRRKTTRRWYSGTMRIAAATTIAAAMNKMIPMHTALPKTPAPRSMIFLLFCWGGVIPPLRFGFFFDDENKSFTPEDAHGASLFDQFFAARGPQLSPSLHRTFAVDFCPRFPNLADQHIRVVDGLTLHSSDGTLSAEPDQSPAGE